MPGIPEVKIPLWKKLGFKTEAEMKKNLRKPQLEVLSEKAMQEVRLSWVLLGGTIPVRFSERVNKKIKEKKS
jgi:hypothetical protein